MSSTLINLGLNDKESSKQNQEKKELEELLGRLPSHKTVNILLVVHAADGCGDVEHFKAYALKMKEMFPKLKLYAYLHLMAVSTASHRIALDFMKEYGHIFENVRFGLDKITPIEGKLFSSLDIAEQKKIEGSVKQFENTSRSVCELYKEIHFILHISRINKPGPTLYEDKAIYEWLQTKRAEKLSNFFLSEYGYSACIDKEIYHESEIPPIGMQGDLGIRMVEEFAGVITAEKRISALLSISDKNFLKCLLMSNSPTEKEVNAYIDSRVLVPAYIQGDFALTFFILTVIHSHNYSAHSGQINFGKITGIDFYVPEKFVNVQLIFELSSLLGLTKEKWAIVSEYDQKANADVPVRIFTHFLDSKDYKKLYYFSQDIAGCSGDDTITTVLSTYNIPLLLCSTSGQSMKNHFLIQLSKTASALGCETVVSYLNKFCSSTTISYRLKWYEYSKYNGAFACDFEKDRVFFDLQKEFIRDYSKEIGSFLLTNRQKLKDEMKVLRNFLFTGGNIFNALPKILLKAVEAAFASAATPPMVTYAFSSAVSVPSPATPKDVGTIPSISAPT